MANTLKLGTDNNWAVKEGSLLGYNDENNNFKPLPFDFTRNSSATRVNEQGLIETVGVNVPRIDFTDGKGSLLLEPTRTNLIASKVNDWITFNSSTTQSNESPDGYNNAVKITSTAIVNSGVYLSGLSVTGNTEIFTIWLKGENGGEILEIGDATNRTTVTLTNEWVRYEAKKTSASASKILYNQTTNPIIQTWYAWGAQLEDNVSYATSYIPTSGSVATRNADSSSQTPPSGIIGQTEGTMYVETTKWVQSNNGRIFSISDGTTSNYILIIQNTTFSNYAVYVAVGGVTQLAYTETQAIADNSKIAVSYKQNDFSISVNGEIVHTDTSGNVPTVSKIYLGSRENGFTTYYSSNPIKEAKLYNTRLSNSELEQLTSN